jgi:hypothetical protein
MPWRWYPERVHVLDCTFVIDTVPGSLILDMHNIGKVMAVQGSDLIGAQVLSSAHAVVLASGTLAPTASLRQQLFPGVPSCNLHHFSCGHVVGWLVSPPLHVSQGTALGVEPMVAEAASPE